MSGDGPIKTAPPEAAPLDEIILGDDDETQRADARPPVTRPSAKPDSLTPKPLEKFDKDTKKRAKLTLRIPDDEVSRPQLAVAPSGEIPIAQPVGDPDATLELPNKAPKAPGIDASDEKGWTPFAPDVDALTPIAPPVKETNGGSRPSYPSHPPSSEEIPVALDLSGEYVEDEQTNPRLPRPLDSEEIKLDEPEQGERLTDPDAEELGADDLVSVESIQPRKEGTFGARFSEAKSAASALSSTTQGGGVPTPRSQPAVAPVMARPEPKELHFAGGAGQLAPPPMTDTAAHRKKTRPWWEELFNDDYIRTMAKVTDAQIHAEATFIEESLGCEAGAMILDLACGTGRHAVEMASRGYQVVGYDLSLSMLARASDEAQERGEKINFVQGDMREMTFEDTFDGVFSWNTSFGFFDEEKNAAVVAKVHKSLKKGGQFLLDVINRDYLARMAPSLAWFEGDGCICMDEMQMDFITSRMKVKRTLMMDDGRTKEIEYSIRVYSLHELGKLLHDNGFRVAEVSGRTGTPGVFFGCESPRVLILAEKR